MSHLDPTRARVSDRPGPGRPVAPLRDLVRAMPASPVYPGRDGITVVIAGARRRAADRAIGATR